MTFLLDATIRVSVVLLFALAMLPLLRRRSAAVRHAVLSAAIFCAFTLPAISPVVPSWSLPDAVDPPAPLTTAAVPRPAPQLEIPEAPVPSGGVDLRAIILYTWVAGLVAATTILLTGAIRLRRIASRAAVVQNGLWEDIAARIAKTYGLRRPLLLLQSDRPSMLVTWGVWRPKLILPAGAADWPEERIHVVLAHELAHIRRSDWIAQIAAELLRAVFWFHPLLWIACNRLRRESEHACDDAVLNLGVAGSDYAAHLLDLARILNKYDLAWLPVLAMARPSTLERRFTAMLNPGLNRASITRSSLALIVIAFAVIVFPVAAFRASALQTTGSVSGRVVDPTGAVIPGVTVSITNPATRTKDVTQTDETGTYAFRALPSGDYTLEAQLSGFADFRTEVKVEAGQALVKNLPLPLKSVSEVVTVTVPRKAPLPLPAGLPRRIRQGGNVQNAKLIAQAKPLFPAALRDTDAEGSVTLEGVVGINGTILSLRVISATPQPEFAQAAMEAVRQWIYQPTILNGEPVEVVTTITVNFFRSR